MDACFDEILAAFFWLEGARDGASGRSNRTFLRIGFNLDPVAFFVLPTQTRGDHFYCSPLEQLTVEIGNDSVNPQRVTLLDKSAVRPQADIEICRMNEQRGLRAPLPPVHVCNADGCRDC